MGVCFFTRIFFTALLHYFFVLGVEEIFRSSLFSPLPAPV